MATNAITIIEVDHGDAVAPATIAEEYAVQADDPHRACTRLSQLFAAIAGGVRAAKVRVRVDTSTDVSKRVTAQTVITHANVTANDTFTIGHVVLTWKASAASEDEVTIGASATADGDNLVTKINAHSKLKGICTASNATGTVTISFEVDPRVALGWQLATSDATAHTNTQPSISGSPTVTSQQITRVYSRGQA